MLAFIRNRRAAGESIESILRASFRARHCQLKVRPSREEDPIVVAEEMRRAQRIYPRLDSISGHGVVPWSNLVTENPDLRFFTFLRPPLERCASEYQYRVAQRGLRQTFESWVQSSSARNHQVRQLCGSENAAQAIEMIRSRMGFVGLVERFHESLVLFRRWVDDDRMDIRYTPKNVSRDARIRAQLLRNLDTRRQLLDANREDLKLQEFVEQQVFPGQIEDYGNRFEMDVEAFEAFNVPPPAYPRQLPSLLLRNVIHRPLLRWLSQKENPTAPPLPPPQQNDTHLPRAA